MKLYQKNTAYGPQNAKRFHEKQEISIKNAFAHPKKEIIFENIFCSLFKTCDNIGQY